MTRGDAERNRVAHAVEALQCISPDAPRDDWVRVLMAAKAAGVSEEDARAWSERGSSFDPRGFRDTWRSIESQGGVGAGTLFGQARERGWRPADVNGHRDGSGFAGASARPRTVQDARSHARHGEDPTAVWERCVPACASHPYVAQKLAQGAPLDGLRQVPEGDPLRIAGESMAGALVVPVRRRDGSLASLQFITPPEVAARLRKVGRPGKLNLPGARLDGWFAVGHLLAGGIAFVCEGIGTAWACWQATGCAAFVTFGASRLRTVARELRELHPQARLVLVPDVGWEEQAESVAREVRADVARLPAGWPRNADASDFAEREGRDALEELLLRAKPPEPEPLPFKLIPFGDLANTAPAAPAYVWCGLVPARHVTLLAGHGGAGKSYLALMLAVSVALGLPLFGIPTRQGNAAVFSAEDGPEVLRERLARVCLGIGVAVQRLQGRLFLLDATGDDATLFTELALAGHRGAALTATYHGLREFARTTALRLLVVDNAADVYDASEIDRRRVRGFLRSLAHIAQEMDGGVLLLGHVDKGTSRKERSDAESYSGSTGWSNAVRSRLFLSREADGALRLQQQKHNLGRLRDPLRLVWPEGGLPAVDEALRPVLQGIVDRGNEKPLLVLIDEFTRRGEYVTTATTSRTNAAKLLEQEPRFPSFKKKEEVFSVLRDSERAGRIRRVTYRGTDRKSRERWEVTQAGRAFAGIAAATAATAATPEVTAPPAVAAEPAATAATSALGGMGGKSAHRTTGEP